MSAEELRLLSERVVNDPDVVYDLTPEQTIELQKHLNPLGNVITEKKSYVNISLVNWKDEYYRKFHLTAMIGYLYRLQMEYLPEDEIEAERLKLVKRLEGVEDAKEIARVRSEHDALVKLLTDTCRRMVLKFLNRNFNYNPDMHLRGSHSENKDDPERVPKDEAIRAVCEISKKAPAIDAKLASKPEQTYKYLRANMLATYQAAVESTKTLKQVLTVMLDPLVDNEDKQGILMKKYRLLVGIVDDMKKIAEPLSASETVDAWQVDPPVNVFHQLNRYITNHYEQLRDVCSALYNEKSDFEYAVIYYNSAKTQEAARDYRVQNESKFRTEVLTIENSGVTLIGPFKENRARVDFYNKNTEVMKRMMEQMETDHKLGKDLMEKQVKKQKKKNIAESGPDAPGLAAYSKAMNVVKDLGAKKVLTREEQDELEAAHAVKEDAEVPDDAIQVDMFFPKTDDEGNTTLNKTKFYSQAEAPLHLQEGSQHTAGYQSKRGDSKSLTEAYKRKTIISKTGQKMEIQVPVKEDSDDKGKEEEGE